MTNPKPIDYQPVRTFCHSGHAQWNATQASITNPLPILANLGSTHTDNVQISDGTSTIGIRRVSARDDRDSPCPTRCQASDNIFPLYLNLMPICQSNVNLIILDQSIIHQKSNTNPIQSISDPAIQRQSCINLPIHHQSINIMPSFYQSANPSPICQSITNPRIRCQSLTNL